MFGSCSKAINIFCSSLDETSLMEGISDVIVVKHKTGEFRSTKFFVCIGPYSAYTKSGCKI
jgi:phosphatidate phosphatase PAH1